MYGFIYITTNLVNSKKYIGKCAYNRRNGWEDYLGSGKILKQAINLYGVENFNRVIVLECETLQELNLAEQMTIAKYDACNNDDFYNIAKGGDGGNTRLGYTQEQFEQYCKNVTRVGSSNGMFGKTHSDEAKRKDGEKTTYRFAHDEEFKERHRQATIRGMQKVDKEKLKFSNRARNTSITCRLCGKEEMVYTSQQLYCSDCKSKYTKWQLSQM